MPPGFSNVPDDFLRAMSDATEALRELNDAGKQGAKTQAEENKQSERGLRRLRDIATNALPLSAAALAAAGIRGGVQALSTGGSFGQGFTGGALNLVRGVTGFNASGAGAVDQAVNRVQGFVGPLAELGYEFSESELRGLVRSEYNFTSRGADEADALSNIRTEFQNQSDAQKAAPILDVAVQAQKAASDAWQRAADYFRAYTTPYNGPGEFRAQSSPGGSPR